MGELFKEEENMIFSMLFAFCTSRSHNLEENKKNLAENQKKIGFRSTCGTGFLQVCIFMYKVNPVFKFIQPNFTLESANTGKSDYHANGRTKNNNFQKSSPVDCLGVRAVLGKVNQKFTFL